MRNVQHFGPRPAAARARAIVVFIALLVPAGALRAQATGGAPHDSLGAIVVTATRARTTVDQMALHTTIITRSEIERSPARTVDQLLRDITGMNQPGAPYYVSDPTGHQAKLRGVTNSKVLVLLDGVPVHDPFYSTIQWFKVPLASIDHIEVVRGGSSSIWGNLAVAGVINIITRRPVDGRGEADVNYASEHTVHASLSKDVAAAHGFAMRAFGDVFTTDGYQTTPSAYLSTVPGKAASGADNFNLELAGYFTPSSAVNGFFRAGYHRQNEQIGGYEMGNNIQKSPDGAAGVQIKVGGSSRVALQAWAQHEQFDKQNGAACFLGATSCGTTPTGSLVQYANSEDWNPYSEVGASGTYSTALPAIAATLQAGLDVRRIAGKDSATTYNKPTTTGPASATINRRNYGQGAQRFVGGFTQLTVFPVSRLQATVAVRYDTWQNEDGIATMTRYNKGVAGATTGGALANSSKASFNPSASARLTVSDAVAFRGAAYRSFRTPGLNNLYRSYSSTSFISIANPHLAPETLTGGEFGVDVDRPGVRLGVTGFQYNTQHLIATYKIQSAAGAPADVVAVCGADLSNCPSSISYYTNSQDAVSRGVEVDAHWQLVPAVGVDVGYSYTDSHYTSTTTGDPTGVQLGAVPKHVATMALGWAPHRRWSLSATARYNGSMYLDVNQTIPQPAFLLLGLSATLDAGRGWQWYGSVVNLTNRTYSDNGTTSASSETLGAPRTVTGGLRWTF